MKGDPTDIMHKQLIKMVNLCKQTIGKHNKAQVLQINPTAPILAAQFKIHT